MFKAVKQWLSSSIRRQVVALLFATASIYAGLHWQIEKKMLLPQFTQLQETEIKQDMQRITSLIDHELASVSQKVADWAAWDDTYQYVLDRNPDYEESNLLLESLVHMQISLLAIFDLNGQLVWGQGCDWRHETPLPLSLLAQGQLPPSHRLLQLQSADDVINGILLCPEGPMLFSAMSIVTSERTGDSHGTMMMGRFLDSECIDQWSRELSVSFSLERWDQQPPQPPIEEIHRQTAAETICLRYSPHESITAYRQLPDLEGRNHLFVQATIPSSILSRGQAAIRFSTLSIFVVGGLLLLTMYAGLHWTLLGRLRCFSQHFQDIAQKSDLSKRIRVSQADEMSYLQSSFNSMLHNLEQSDRALRASEETYRQIFNTAQDCLFVLNTKGHILAANPSAQNLFGLDDQDLTNHDMRSFVQPQKQSEFEHFLKQALHQGEASQELAMVCSQHQILDVTALGRQTQMLEQTCVLMVLRDIHERREIQNNLQQARQEIQNVNELKNGLLRNITHEMRSPLNHIMGFCSLLSEDQLCQTHQEYLAHIRQSSEELISMINSIIDISRIEAGTLSLNIDNCSISSLLHEIEFIGQTKAEKKGLTFTLARQETLPETITTDSQRLQQCLQTLIDNAVKFTSEGTIQIKVYTQTQASEDCLCFDICDNGPGIPPEAQAEMFTSFAQADISATRVYGGMGTGLAVTKGILELLGGSITVQSEPGRGSIFTVTLALNTPSPAQETHS